MLMIQDYSLNLLYEQQAKQLKRLLEWENKCYEGFDFIYGEMTGLFAHYFLNDFMWVAGCWTGMIWWTYCLALTAIYIML